MVKTSNIGIFCKLDWFQAIFYDVTFDYVLNHFLEMNIGLDDAVTNASYERHYGCYDHQMVYDINGVTVSANYERVVSCEGNPFSTTFSRVMLIIGGKGLDFLRAWYDDPEDLDRILRKQPEVDAFDENIWRVTRVDFAFDFVNYKYDIYNTMFNELQELSYEGRIKTKGIKSPISYSARTGSEKTIYIGKNRANRLLRVYDKKLEQMKDGVLSSLPDDSVDYDVESWERMELQTRNNWAEYYFYGCHDYLQVLRSIYDYYSFTDREGRVSDFWQNLFDWEEIPVIIQNAKYSKLKLTKDTLVEQGRTSMDILCAFAAVYGLDWVINNLRERFSSHFWSENYKSRRTRKLLRRIDCLNDFKNDSSQLQGAKVANYDGRSILQLK